MRLTTSSGPLAALSKLLTTFLLVHLLAGHTSAYPFTSTNLEAREPVDALSGNHLDARTLRKRSNCQASDDPDASFYNCDGTVPGVDETLTKVQEWGVVGSLPSVFYTDYPVNLAVAKRWASCFFAGEPEAPGKDSYLYAIWRRLVDPKWLSSESFWVMESQPDDMTEADSKYYSDLVLKHLAQAFAEAASGDVYLVVDDAVAPDDRSWDSNKAWGGWEWPALTRNSNVKQIFRVDPKKSNEPRVIWSSSDGPQGSNPKGFRGSTEQTNRL